jgi:hypothetical protein
MLTNLLPGIRDIRTPLATGYLWLLTLWFWIPSHFKHTPPTTGIPGDITHLAHYASRAGVGIAISFAAYLVGVLSKSLNPPLVRFGTFCAYLPTLIKAGIGRTFHAIGINSPIRFWRSEIRFLDFWRRLFYTTTSLQTEEQRAEIELAFYQTFSIVTAQFSRAGIYIY